MLKTIWAVWERGAAGMQSQALGLAEALFATGGFSLPQGFEVAFRRPYGLLPTHPFFASLNALTEDTRPNFQPPWPDLLIASGRKAAILALAVKKASGGQTRTILTQDPRTNPRHWSLLVVPEHDQVRGPNVILTQGAMHRVTRLKLDAGAEALRRELAHLPSPRVAVLVGGSNRNYTLDEEWMRGFVGQLRQMVQRSGCSLLATVSRRTGEAEAAILRGGLASLPGVLWDGKGPNPYFGYLALADAVIVTCESISMISEACSTGKPVLVAKLPGRSKRFEIFYDSLLKRGLIQWFDGRLMQWDNGRIDDMDRVPEEIRQRLGWA
ncbi:MAG TPA: mitochondrial fission ELM1 family protein [Ferrovibrio sp.]|jgi:mitochondrial fission protein ELM1|uniref:mitochondrial fission ELM1 family protein n=1 Tax=Ferrovibrio sp. TaxID=1917215 RepID=UPI002B4AD554|nr:mitochondrial fission ELM1 family protein [Ferrovibrio sp.]HLT77213.1 mitochondrial fission ELM1 family protein [Ferrovibrio sp.]